LLQYCRQMNCPFFEEKYFRYCKAMAKRIMVPSRDEKEEFCCEHYRECPYYREHEGKEGACRIANSATMEESNEEAKS